MPGRSASDWKSRSPSSRSTTLPETSYAGKAVRFSVVVPGLAARSRVGADENWSRLTVTTYVVPASRPAAWYSPFDVVVTGSGTAPVPTVRVNTITAPTRPAPPVVSTCPVTTRLVLRVNDASTTGNEFGANATLRLGGSNDAPGFSGVMRYREPRSSPFTE